MQVKDLIECLEDMDPEAEVHFAYNWGDYWRTEVAPKVVRVGTGAVVFSDYHRMHKMVEMDDENCYDEESGEERVDETLRRVVVLS
jgi:hypothetical protein